MVDQPCECGLGLRPRRLFGFLMEPADGDLGFSRAQSHLGAAVSRLPIRVPTALWSAMARYNDGTGLRVPRKICLHCYSTSGLTAEDCARREAAGYIIMVRYADDIIIDLRHE
jgi:hypothetical protein